MDQRSLLRRLVANLVAHDCTCRFSAVARDRVSKGCMSHRIAKVPACYTYEVEVVILLPIDLFMNAWETPKATISRSVLYQSRKDFFEAVACYVVSEARLVSIIP